MVPRLSVLLGGAVLGWSLLPAVSRAEPVDRATVVVEGLVVDENDQPAGAVETKCVGAGTPTAAVFTDAEGKFALPVRTTALGSVYAALLARSADGRLGYLAASMEKLEPVRIVLRSPRTVRVRVVDKEGAPAAGAEVLFLDGVWPIESAVADARGELSLLVPADCRNWSVVAKKAQAGFDYRSSARRRRPMGEPAPLPESLELRLDGARTVRVRAVDQHGGPVAGVRVGPWTVGKPDDESDVNLSGARSLFAETDAEGVAVLDWLPEKTRRAISILSHSEDYYAPDRPAQVDDKKSESELTISLLPQELLSGRVVHADGKPAIGMNVFLIGQGANWSNFQGVAVTDADGRYRLKVYSEQAYLVRAGDKSFASPCRSDVVVRAGRPLEGVDLTLGPATRVHGRVTVGRGRKPVASAQLSAVMDRGRIPEELPRKADDRTYYGLRLHIFAQTDAEGRYQFHLGPGDYQIHGPAHTEPVILTIPEKDPPAAVEHDFHMPRPESGPLAVRVLDQDGKAVAGAEVEGRYTTSSARRWFGADRTDDDGAFQIERSLDPLVIFARSDDGSLAGVVNSDAEESTATVVLAPTASAKGRLVDLAGKPIAAREIRYGIRVYQGPPPNSPFSDSFGGVVTTDADGAFSVAGLVPKQTYFFNIYVGGGVSRTATQVAAPEARLLELGDVVVDPEPYKPYTPPTPQERTAEAFKSKGDTPLVERLPNLLAEAEREYTRPLLLIGRPNDPACVELFRLFHEDDAGEETPTPAQRRWEFELAVLDLDRPEVKELAAKIGVDLAGGASVLALLDADGSLAETLPLELKDNALDRRLIGAWMDRHKPPTRDAQAMLDEALARAKAEDKRVFFIFSASWCGPCRRLAQFLAPHKPELEKHYVFVKLDVSRDKHAGELRKRFEKGESGGVPWYCILDGEAETLATSNLPEVNPQYGTSNMGFPTLPGEIDHFLGMLRTTAPGLADEQLDLFRKELSGKN